MSELVTRETKTDSIPQYMISVYSPTTIYVMSFEPLA